MKATITTKRTYDKHTFEIVDRIPEKFFVWNISGIDGYEEYVPICELLYPEDKNCYHINRSTLKAIKMTKEEVKILLSASAFGVNNLKEVEKALKSKKRGLLADRRRAYAEKTVEIFKKIS